MKRINTDTPAGRPAFTLLELLVVIAIIAVLAAIIVPVLGEARRKSMQTSSANNLRQWGVALNLSIGDNDFEMPWEGQPVTVADDTAWYNRLPRYISAIPFSQMTAADFPRAGQKSVWINPAVPTSVNETYKPYLFCYAMNYYLSTSKIPRMRVTRLTKPSATVFMAEKGDEFANCNPTYIKAYFGTGDIATGKLNGANFLFCDGHIGFVLRQDFDPKYNPKVTQNNPPDDVFTFVPYDGAVQQ